MNKLELYQQQIRIVDHLAARQTFIHSLNAKSKLMTTIIFLLIVIAQPKLQVATLLALFVYPIFIITAGNIDVKFLALRLLITSPFIIFFAASGLVFSNVENAKIFGMTMPQSSIVAISISLKFILSILASTLLTATSGYYKLAQAVYTLPLPKLFLQQIIFLYRYIHVMLVEIEYTLQAYLLKAGKTKISKNIWGSLIGQLLIRTISRCEKINQAMILRGFNGQIIMLGDSKMTFVDWVYIFVNTSIFLLITLYVN